MRPGRSPALSSAGPLPRSVSSSSCPHSQGAHRIWRLRRRPGSAFHRLALQVLGLLPPPRAAPTAAIPSYGGPQPSGAPMSLGIGATVAPDPWRLGRLSNVGVRCFGVPTYSLVTRDCFRSLGTMASSIKACLLSWLQICILPTRL
jgi:hypothetical protein